MRKLAPLIAIALLVLPAPAAAKPPKPGTPQARGNVLYGTNCLACHGANGEGVKRSAPYRAGFGPGRTQARITAIAPSLQGVGALAADFYLRTGYMPLPHLGVQPRRGKVRFNDRQIRDLVAYVASLGKGPPIPHPHPAKGNLSEGQNLFTEHCAGCHQVVGEGGYVTGAVPPPLEDATDTQIAEAVRIGPYVMPKFTKKAISDKELDSIIAYVDYAKHPQDKGGWAIGHLGPVPEGLVLWFMAATALVLVCMVIGERLRRE